MHSSSKRARKLLQVNIKLLGVVSLTTVRLRRSLPACPTLSSGTVLMWDLGKLQLFCSICERYKSVQKQLPVQWINSSLCVCLNTGQAVCEVRAEYSPLGWADRGDWLWKALWRVMGQCSERERRLNPGSYKDKVSVHHWTPVLFKAEACSTA